MFPLPTFTRNIEIVHIRSLNGNAMLHFLSQLAPPWLNLSFLNPWFEIMNAIPAQNLRPRKLKAAKYHDCVSCVLGGFALPTPK